MEKNKEIEKILKLIYPNWTEFDSIIFQNNDTTLLEEYNKDFLVYFYNNNKNKEYNYYSQNEIITYLIKNINYDNIKVNSFAKIIKKLNKEEFFLFLSKLNPNTKNAAGANIIYEVFGEKKEVKKHIFNFELDSSFEKDFFKTLDVNNLYINSFKSYSSLLKDNFFHLAYNLSPEKKTTDLSQNIISFICFELVEKNKINRDANFLFSYIDDYNINISKTYVGNENNIKQPLLNKLIDYSDRGLLNKDWLYKKLTNLDKDYYNTDYANILIKNNAKINFSQSQKENLFNNTNILNLIDDNTLKILIDNFKIGYNCFYNKDLLSACIKNFNLMISSTLQFEAQPLYSIVKNEENLIFLTKEQIIDIINKTNFSILNKNNESYLHLILKSKNPLKYLNNEILDLIMDKTLYEIKSNFYLLAIKNNKNLNLSKKQFEKLKENSDYLNIETIISAIIQNNKKENLKYTDNEINNLIEKSNIENYDNIFKSYIYNANSQKINLTKENYNLLSKNYEFNSEDVKHFLINKNVYADYINDIDWNKIFDKFNYSSIQYAIEKNNNFILSTPLLFLLYYGLQSPAIPNKYLHKLIINNLSNNENNIKSFIDVYNEKKHSINDEVIDILINNSKIDHVQDLLDLLKIQFFNDAQKNKLIDIFNDFGSKSYLINYLKDNKIYDKNIHKIIDKINNINENDLIILINNFVDSNITKYILNKIEIKTSVFEILPGNKVSKTENFKILNEIIVNGINVDSEFIDLLFKKYTFNEIKNINFKEYLKVINESTLNKETKKIIINKIKEYSVFNKFKKIFIKKEKILKEKTEEKKNNFNIENILNYDIKTKINEVNHSLEKIKKLELKEYDNLILDLKSITQLIEKNNILNNNSENIYVLLKDFNQKLNILLDNENERLQTNISIMNLKMKKN